VGLRRSRVACSGRAGGAGRQSTALSTARRICWNHQAARERSIWRRRQAGRSQAGAPFKERSSCARPSVGISDWRLAMGESGLVMLMFFIVFFSMSSSSHRGLDEYWVTP
jgi:hypothetical protein